MRGALLSSVLLLALAPLLLGACGDGLADGKRVRLATTTSTRDSGLLDAILPAFESEYGMHVDVIGVGTGQALALGARGEADLLLVHARERELAFVAAGHGTEHRDIMWNDFVIAGPRADPAKVDGLASAAVALERIAAAGAVFVSRGDDSGTHIRERALWKAAGGRARWGGYWSAGQGMGACLTIADQKDAYVLTDRGTLLAHRGKSDLQILVEGDAALKNPYGAMLVSPERHPHVNAVGARALLDYLSSQTGQRAIGAYRVDGQILFHPHSPGGE